MTNAEISDIFSLLAKLMDIHGENSFKIKTYANAAFAIDKHPAPLKDLPVAQLASVRGIGDSTAKKIAELLETGSLKALEDLVAKTPEGILELMKIKGVGPKKIAQLWHEMQIESPGELLYACNENRLVDYKGFGEKTQNTIRESLEFYFSNQRRFLYASIVDIAEEIRAMLAGVLGENSLKIAGAIRCQHDIIDELEFVWVGNQDTCKEKLRKLNELELQDEQDGLKYLFNQHIPVRLYCCEETLAGNTLFIHSAPKEFIDYFEKKFPEAALDTLSYPDEESIFTTHKLPFIPPPCRLSKEVLDATSKIDDLVQLQDIRGVIHNHSTWSDGKNTIGEMARACIDKGYEYLVMSDHSQTSFYARGLTAEQIRLQHQEIDTLNSSLAPFRIFKSIECDILGDGRLDYTDDILSGFDLVICSIHQNLKMTREKAMERILKAVAHPATTILGHPSGRLLLSRKGYPVDHAELIEACRKHGVVIEINANPRRLDMDWSFIQQAVDAGVMLSINPDAHSIRGIDDIRYGVLSAQKGLLSRHMNLSSFTLTEFESFLAKKKA